VRKARLPILQLLALLLVLPQAAFADTPTPAPQRTAPPQIIRMVTTPFCARLHDKVRPAVAMILQNDRTIAKSPALFTRYARGAYGAQDPTARNFSNGAPPANDSIYNQTPETQMALQRMSYLVSPIAQNLIAAQRLLDDAQLMTPTGNPADDQSLARIKKQLLETVAYQSANLDLINGWVTTQQLGDMQHAGMEFISQITGSSEMLNQQSPMRATPNPWQDPNTPGLAPNPYDIELAAVPGLSVGYNPLSRIMEAQQWLLQETTKKENAAATSITTALSECNK
jgi:hypothetical protein